MHNQSEDLIYLRVHLSSSAEKVYSFLATDSGRSTFWADSAIEENGIIYFHFSNGMEHRGKILESIPNHRFSVEYFGGSRATFELSEDIRGGTDVSITETSLPKESLAEHRAGWVTVLLSLKAAVDFSIDLRNPDPDKNWEKGYVDV